MNEHRSPIEEAVKSLPGELPTRFELVLNMKKGLRIDEPWFFSNAPTR
jgi:hypothetical protein